MKPHHTINQSFVQLSSVRPVRAQPVPRQGSYPLHDHEFYEIGVVVEGQAVHQTVRGEEALQRGSVVVVAPGQIHGFRAARPFQVVNVYYLAEWFLSNFQALRDIDCLVPLFFEAALFPSRQSSHVIQFQMADEDLVGCLGDLEDMQRESARSDPQILFLESCFFKFLVRLSRAFAHTDGVAAKPNRSQPITRGLMIIDAAVDKGEHLDVHSVARSTGVSLSHFCRLFKLETGMTAGDYFQRRRIHRACHRLLTTDASVTELAHALGFTDSAHFNRRFKDATGLTPRGYRLKYSKPPG